ncbi:MAG: OmpA family protein [Candidatus Pseudomonas colombiensis]|nr:MAG: OmpA family protein [Pseudomonas sp.]
MSSNKSLALAICLTVTGCAQTPQNDADGGHWWSFGSDKATSKDVAPAAEKPATVAAQPAAPAAKPAAPAAPAAANKSTAAAKPAATPASKAPASKAAAAPAPAAKPAAVAEAPAPAPAAVAEPVAKAESGGSWWWPFSSKDSDADKPVAETKKVEAAPAPVAVAAKADSETHWWWPFAKSEPKPLSKVDVADIPMPDPKITQAWLDTYEPRLREAIKDSKLQLERRENVLVVIAPVDGSFNPDRPAMLLPVTLGPFTRVAKAVEGDTKTAVLVLGHADTTGAAGVNQKLSRDRAQSVAAIFSLSGLKQDRLMLRGMGSVMPRAANDSAPGRALNRRVEIMLTQRSTMLGLLSKYNQPTPSEAELVAVQDVKPAVAPVAAAKKSAAPAKKAVAAKKPAAKKAPAKKAAAPAKKAATGTAQAKN